MTPPGGGSRGVGPPSSAPNAAEIVRNLFEGDKKKLTDQQQAQSLRDMSRQQQELRDASGTGRATQEAEGHHEEVRQQAQPQVRTRGSDASGLVAEKEIDSFLNRASTQQSQREAGKEMARPQTLSSINVQAWTVAGSPHTPETARNLLQQRHAQAHANNPNQSQSSPSNPNPATASFVPRGTPTLPRASVPLPTTPSLPIRYAGTASRNEGTPERPFAGRPLILDQLRGQVQRMVQDQLGRTGQQALGTQAQVAVHIRGNVLFVRDGEKLRAFRMEKDGSLSELPSDDASEHPLSPEAQKLLEKVLRQKGLQSKLSGEGAEHAGELGEAHLSEELAERLAEEKTAAKGELDFETRFALLLHEVLEEGKMLGKELSGDPEFPTKGDWEAFFANLLKMGNQEKSSKKTMDSILNMIFRGMFKKKGQGNVLVGDLKYLKSGKAKEEKFAQVNLTDAQLMEMLQGLKPGQKLSKDMLARCFGEELGYLMLAHAEERSFNMATNAEKNVVFNPKSNVDLYGQARLEKTLLSSRKDKRFPDAAKNGGAKGGEAALSDKPVPSNPTELMGLRERFSGRPRHYTLIIYGVFASLLAILLFFILMKVMD